MKADTKDERRRSGPAPGAVLALLLIVFGTQIAAVGASYALGVEAGRASVIARADSADALARDATEAGERAIALLKLAANVVPICARLIEEANAAPEPSASHATDDGG